ncbi:MAG TPA: hypothetical protein VID50_12100 [Candidatus Eisenbacteria bacterium]|jgi:hypothetical protein
MTEGTEQGLARRLDSLEAANRRLRGLLALAGVGVLALAALGQSAGPAEVLRAKRFEVVDGEGRVRVRMGLEEDGRPLLRVEDAGGKERILLGFAPGGKDAPGGHPRLAVRDAGGTDLVRVGEGEDGRPEVHARRDPGPRRERGGTGVVLAADPAAGIYLVSGGTDRGLRAGDELTVFRGDEFVAAVIVDRVFADKASVVVKEVEGKPVLKSGIRQGDRVAWDL